MMPGSRLVGLRFLHVIVKLTFSVFRSRQTKPARLTGPTRKGADYMSRAGSVSRDGSVCWDDCSARYYMRQASPPVAKFRSCHVKRWLHQREWIECFCFRLSIILVYNFQFYVALWSDKPLCVMWKEKYRSSGEPFCSEAKFSNEKVLARQSRLHGKFSGCLAGILVSRWWDPS